MTFRERLEQAMRARDSMLCMGLDPDPQRFPEAVGREPDAILPFLESIIVAVADLVCAFKPQVAHFAALGAEQALQEVIAMIRREAPQALVILDAKRGDIGTTAAMYAREAFDRYEVDAVTVNPYFGSDGLAPFLERPDRGAAILCCTSNASADELQTWPAEQPLFERVACLAVECGKRFDNAMLVAGATRPVELKRIRELAPELPLLVPGVGTQGGDVNAVVEAGLDKHGWGLLVSSSRSILYASAGADFAEAAAQEARRLRDALRQARRRHHPIQSRQVAE